jgi:hypothetical protein
MQANPAPGTCFYLKVQLPTGDTTMLKVEGTNSVGEIITMIEDKKMTIFKNIKMAIKTPDGSQIEVFNDQVFSNFKKIDLLVLGTIILIRKQSTITHTSESRSIQYKNT